MERKRNTTLTGVLSRAAKSGAAFASVFTDFSMLLPSNAIPDPIAAEPRACHCVRLTEGSLSVVDSCDTSTEGTKGPN